MEIEKDSQFPWEMRWQNFAVQSLLVLFLLKTIYLYVAI